MDFFSSISGMGKTDPFMPKGLANKMKAKGLQKLKWYCQLCEKQCRDENGFQCHIKSESHSQQMNLFKQNSSAIINNYSNEFQRGFLEILKIKFGKLPVLANRVYQEYIKDKQHVHMNATRWKTLQGFCQFLATKNLIKILSNPQSSASNTELVQDDLKLIIQLVDSREHSNVKTDHANHVLNDLDKLYYERQVQLQLDQQEKAKESIVSSRTSLTRDAAIGTTAAQQSSPHSLASHTDSDLAINSANLQLKWHKKPKLSLSKIL